jgi:hypothetical protein
VKDDLLLLISEGAFGEDLARTLGATPHPLPPAASDDATLEAWRARRIAEQRSGRVVVAIDAEGATGPVMLGELDDDAWLRRAERPFLRWCLALGAASECCADGGAIVAVAEAPPALDAAGFAPETGLADTVGALVASIARAEGGRGVRANAVTTCFRLRLGALPAPPPPLAGFPGSMQDVADAVRLLLSDEARSVTGRSLPADFGRSW